MRGRSGGPVRRAGQGGRSGGPVRRAGGSPVSSERTVSVQWWR